MNMPFPKILEGKELEPASGAYEKLEPALRARLKSQIALLHEAWLPEGRDGGLLRALPDGARLVRQKQARDWALFVLDEAYASPAGLIAALLPALMAAVPDIFIIRRGGAAAPLHPALSAALELLGRDDVYALPPEACSALATGLYTSGSGRVIALGCSINEAVNLPVCVKIGLDGVKIEAEALNWLHPGAEITAYKAGETFHAIICARPGAGRTAPLMLDQAHAYMWFWPDLNPDFFRRESILLSENNE